MSPKKQKRQPVPKELLKFVREKLSTATTDPPLAQQATAWFADQKKVDNGEVFGGRSVASFISLVYRLRSAKGRKRKAKRVRKAVAIAPAKTKSAAAKPTETKPMTTFLEAMNAYEAYLKLAPRLHQADEFIRKCGLAMVVVDGKPTLQKK